MAQRTEGTTTCATGRSSSRSTQRADRPALHGVGGEVVAVALEPGHAEEQAARTGLIAPIAECGDVACGRARQAPVRRRRRRGQSSLTCRDSITAGASERLQFDARA